MGKTVVAGSELSLELVEPAGAGRRALVLGIGVGGDHVVAVGGVGWSLIRTARDGRAFVQRAASGRGLRDAHVRGNDIWTVGEWGHVAHSSDRGLTWEVHGWRYRGCLFGVVENTDGSLWIAGDKGQVARSTDGKKWRKVPGVKESIGRIAASALGVLIPTDAPGRLYIGRGSKVRPTALEAGVDLMKAALTPAGTLLVVGKGGAIFRSTDEGASFEAVDAGVTVLLTSLACLSDGRVVVVGAEGTLLLSEDDGCTWRALEQSITRGILWSAEVHRDTVLIGGEDGLMMRLGQLPTYEPVPLPPIEGEEVDDGRPEHWRAPAPSRGIQDWTPEWPPLEKRNGVFLTPLLRSWLWPRRGGPEVPIRPLPTPQAAWASFRSHLWSIDRLRMTAKQVPSAIWAMVTGTNPRYRAFGERMLEPALQPIAEDDARTLLRLRTDHYFLNYANSLDEHIIDLLVTTLGLPATLRLAFEELRELPFLIPGHFGRLRSLLVLADEEAFAEAQRCILEASRAYAAALEAKRARGKSMSLGRQVDFLWASTFLLPAEGGPEARAIHEEALKNIRKFGNFGAHGAALASGDLDTLERYLAVNPGHCQHFFADIPQMYIVSPMVFLGAEIGPALARMKPGSPWTNKAEYNIVWCKLLAHVDHDDALAALLKEHHRMPEGGWAKTGLELALGLNGDRVRAWLQGQGEGELLESLSPAPVPVPASGAGKRALDEPSPYEPPEAVHVEPAPEGAPASVVEWSAAERERAREKLADITKGLADAAQSLATPTQLDEAIAHYERWALPPECAHFMLFPSRYWERLFALGLDPENTSNRYVLPAVMLRGGEPLLPLLIACLGCSDMLEIALEVAQPFGDVRVAGAMIDAFAGKKHKAPGKHWLLRHPRHAAWAAIDRVRRDKKDKAASRALRFLDARGHRALVLELAGDGRGAIEALLNQDPLTPAVRKKQKLPAYALPQLVDADGVAATPEEAEEALHQLAWSNADEPHSALTRARWTAVSRAEFVWALFQGWLDDGASAKQQWCLQALGFWGNDEVAHKLTALAKRWPGVGASKRAQWALAALANIGTESALMNINLLAEKSRFPAFKAAAATHIAQIARARELSPDELADRLAPRLDLEDEGAILDFGARTFSLSFNEALAPVIRDESGKVLRSLPKARKDDDATKAKAATARYRALKKATKTAAALQVTRLERALATQRALPVAVFREHFAGHPWMTHLTQRLVWAVVGSGQTFKVEDDGAFIDAEYEPVELSDDASVVLAHPLNLSEEVRGAWAGVLADYMLIQPFPQLDRLTFGADAVAGVLGSDVNFRTLLRLEQRGWERCDDDQFITGFRRPCGPGTAVLTLAPGWHPQLEAEDIDPQTLEALTLSLEDEEDASLETLDAVTLSELIYDVQRLTGQ